MAMNEQEQAFKDLTEAVANMLSKYESGERERSETIQHVEKLTTDLSGLQAEISISAAAIGTAVGRLPKQMEVRLKHRFEGRAKVFALVFMVALLFASIAIGLWWGSHRENNGLRKQGWQYRYLQLIHPEMTSHGDSLYIHDPTAFKQMVERMEADKRAIKQAENISRKKEMEARKAKEKVEKLKRGSR